MQSNQAKIGYRPSNSKADTAVDSRPPSSNISAVIEEKKTPVYRSSTHAKGVGVESDSAAGMSLHIENKKLKEELRDMQEKYKIALRELHDKSSQLKEAQDKQAKMLRENNRLRTNNQELSLKNKVLSQQLVPSHH